MAEDEAGAWHGWAHEDNAVFVSPHPEGEHIALYVQAGRVTELAAVFVDPAMAQMFMDWMDESLTATGNANSELVRRLQADQPLAFATPQAPRDVEMGDDDD